MTDLPGLRVSPWFFGALRHIAWCASSRQVRGAYYDLVPLLLPGSGLCICSVAAQTHLKLEVLIGS